MVFSTIKNKFWWGGEWYLETESGVFGAFGICFRRQKSEKFPFCRPYSPILSCRNGGELPICRRQITYLSHSNY